MLEAILISALVACTGEAPPSIPPQTGQEGPQGPPGPPGPAGMVGPEIILALPAEVTRLSQTTMQVAAIGPRPFDEVGMNDVSFRGLPPEPVVLWISVRSPNNMLVRISVPPSATGTYNLIIRSLVLRDALTVLP